MTLHRPYGNLDEVGIGDNGPIKPFITSTQDSEIRVGIVEESDGGNFSVKVRDVKTGARGIECFVLQNKFSTVDKSGTYKIPTPDSKVLYFLSGGNKGFILGNVVTGIVGPDTKFEDELNGDPGFENFVNRDSNIKGDYPSDFGWGPGDDGFINKYGKIKLTRAGIIVLKSAPFCYTYMFPARQLRLSSFMNDEDRGIGYIRRRRTFISPLPIVPFHANYKMEMIEDIPSDPQTVLKKEEGFCDRATAFFSQNHQNSLDITSHIQNSIESAQEVIRARAIQRTIIAKTKKTQGERLLFAPVYKYEKRVDGTTIEQIGHVPADPLYSLEIVKSPTGYLHVVCRQNGKVPTAILKMDAVTGSIEIAANSLSLTSLMTPINITAVGVNVEGNLININGDQVNINAQTAMTINAPSINSYPVPQPKINQMPQAVTAALLPVDVDNTPLDEQKIGEPNATMD